MKKRLAACVQMIPAESLFIWDWKINKSSETLLLIESKPAIFDDIKALIKMTLDDINSIIAESRRDKQEDQESAQ